MAQDVEQLLTQTLSRVNELYTSRPITQPVCNLENFLGEPCGTNWSDWEKQFGRVAVLSGATSSTQKVVLLSVYLRGAALLFYDELERRSPALVDWNAWSTRFLERFPDNRQLDVKYEQLVVRSQRTGESVSSFAADIRRLGKRAFSSWTGIGEFDSIIKNHFINRLVPNIRRWVQNAEPSSFEDAVTESEKQELRESQYNRTDQENVTTSLIQTANQLQNLVQQLSTVSLASVASAGRGEGCSFEPQARNLHDQGGYMSNFVHN